MTEIFSGPTIALDALIDGLVHGPRCHPGDDIVAATGELSLTWCDIELPGALPLRLRRRYSSAYRHGRWFGQAWASWLDQHLELDDERVVLCTSDGRLIHYPAPAPGTRVFPAKGPHWALAWDGVPGGTLAIADPRRGIIRYFGPPHQQSPLAGAEGMVLPLLAIADRDGNQIRVGYEISGSPTRVRHSGGYEIGVTTAEGRVIELRFLGGNHLDVPAADGEPSVTMARFDYDDHGRLVAETGPDGKTRKFRYDERGLMVSSADRTEVTSTYSYDDKRRCVRVSGEAGSKERRFRYDEVGRTTTVSDRAGRTWVYAADEHNRIISETDPFGCRTRKAWDERGRLTEITDPLGRTTRFAYGEGDLPSAVERPDGTRATVYLDGSGAPAQVVAPDGGLWEYTHDESGHRTSITDPAEGRTAFTYDTYGRAISCTAPTGHVRTAAYDRAGLIIECRDPLGATTSIVRDAFGRPVRVVAPTGFATTVGWTVDGLLTLLTRDYAHEEWAYDPEGRPTGYRNTKGEISRIKINKFGLPAVYTTTDGVSHHFEYDDELRLTTVSGPGGSRSFRYDTADRLVRERHDNGSETVYRRDAAGRITVKTRLETNRADTGHGYARDADDRGPACAAYEYDALDRVVAVVSDGRRDARHYDALGHMVSRVMPSGLNLNWTYDIFGYPSRLLCGPFAVEYSYDGNGREIERRLGPDLAIVQTWDSTGRLASQAVRRGKPVAAITAALTPLSGPRDLWLRTYAYDSPGQWTIDEKTLEPSDTRQHDDAPEPQETDPTCSGFHLTVRDPAGQPVALLWPDGVVTHITVPNAPFPDDPCPNLPRPCPTTPWLMLRAHDSLDRYLQHLTAQRGRQPTHHHQQRSPGGLLAHYP